MPIVDRRYSVAEGLAYKAPCRVATTANITLSGLQTVDGVALAADDRVLVKDQSTASENGIYAASTGTWTRERDFDGALDVVTGTAVYITAGTANARHIYIVSTTGTILPGTTSIAFIQDATSDAISAATAAEASASAASTSASNAATSATNAATSATNAATSATNAAASAALAQAAWYATKAAAEAATIDASIPAIVLLGYAAIRDAPPAMYVRQASEPSHPGKLQSDDGAWWAITPALGGAIFPEQFGAKNDGETDDNTAIQNAEICRYALGCWLEFLPGNYYTHDMQISFQRPRWRGSVSNGTILTLDGTISPSLWATGAGGYTDGLIENITLWAPSGRTSGVALYFDGSATYQPDEFKTINLKITGVGTWTVPLQHIGMDRTSPQGIRVVTHHNLFIGRDVTAGVYGSNMVQLQIIGGGIYGGTTNQLQLEGDVSAGKNCTLCFIQAFNVQGQLNVDDTTLSVFSGYFGSIVIGADGDDNCFMGVNSGATTNSGSGNNLAALA